ncbi:hypothetical protein Tco_0123527 [Tanacetum coccineum]
MIQPELEGSTPLDSVVVLRYEKRSKSENKGKVPTEMELVLEQTLQGTSYEVSVSAEGVEELKRKVKIKGEKKEALLTLRQKPAGNPVKEILLKLNLPDHRSILMDSKVTPTKHGRMTKPYSSPCFIANYFIAYLHKDGHGGTWFQLTHRFIATFSYLTDKHKDIMKAQVHVSRPPLL